MGPLPAFNRASKYAGAFTGLERVLPRLPRAFTYKFVPLVPYPRLAVTFVEGLSWALREQGLEQWPKHGP